MRLCKQGETRSCFYKIILKNTRKSETSQPCFSSKHTYRPIRARAVAQLFYKHRCKVELHVRIPGESYIKGGGASRKFWKEPLCRGGTKILFCGCGLKLASRFRGTSVNEMKVKSVDHEISSCDVFWHNTLKDTIRVPAGDPLRLNVLSQRYYTGLLRSFLWNKTDNRFSFKLCPLNIYHMGTSILLKMGGGGGGAHTH